MRRRCILLSLLALLAVQPLHAQNWMGRYLNDKKAREAQEAERDRKKREEEQARRIRATTLTEAFEQPPERIPKGVAVEDVPVIPTAGTTTEPAPVAISPFATTPSPPPATLQTQPAEEPEVRRAIPVARPVPATEEPIFEAPRSTLPPSPPNLAEEEIPKARAVYAPDSPPATPRRAGAIVSEPAAEGEPMAPPADATASAVEAPKPDEVPSVSVPPSALSPEGEIRLSPGTGAASAEHAQFTYANNFFAKKEYDLAAPEFERYLSLYPNGPHRAAALFRVAECYRIQGSLNAARRNYEAIIYTVQTGEFIGPSSYRLGEICYQEENYTGAVSFFRKSSVWVKDPAIVLSAKFYAARSLEKLNFVTDAIQAFEDVLSVRTDNPFIDASRLSLVHLLNASGKRSQALVLLNTIRKESKDPALIAEVTARIALILADQKQYKKAEEEFRSALAMPEIGTWREVAEVGLLRLYYQQGNFNRVIALYKDSPQEFSPSALPEVLLIVANSYRQLGNHAEARTIYDQILQSSPDSIHAKDASYERLVALYNANAPELLDEIDAYLDANLESSGRRDQLTLMKAESLYKTKRFGAASSLYADLEDSSLSTPLKAEARFKLGWCYTQIADFPGAIQAFSVFLAKHPAHKMASAALAQRAFSYEQVKNYKAAVADFNDLLARFPKAKEREFALQRKALILGQQDDSKAMVETFRQLLKEFPNTQAAGQASYWIGLTAFQAKNYKEAVPALQDARKKDKEFTDRASALILASLFYMEERDALADEVDQANPEVKVQPEILRWLGTELLKINQPGRAAKYLAALTKRGDEAEETNSGDWLALGRAYTALDNWPKAEEALHAFLKKATDPIPRASGYLALGRAQLGARAFDAAKDSATRALELQPEGRLNAQGRFLLGDIAIATADYEVAAKHFMSVALVFDDPVMSPQSLEKAHIAYQRAGDATQAAKVLNTLKSRFPEYKPTLL